MHSLWSDGSASIADMAAAAVELNYEYIAITDHAKGLKIAGGIDEAQLGEQGAEIDAVNRSLDERGAQAQGLALDRAEPESCRRRRHGASGISRSSTLSSAAFIRRCGARRIRPSGTSRRCAIRRFRFSAIPRGRIYNYRAGLSADWPRVFALAAELDKAVEIDAYPDRQDLSPDLLVLAQDAGCRISFGTDSHGPSQLRFMAFAAASALRAGIARERILNFMSRDELLDWVREVRGNKRSKKGRN